MQGIFTEVYSFKLNVVWDTSIEWDNLSCNFRELCDLKHLQNINY